MENDDDVDLEFDFELRVLDSGAAVDLREEHVARDLDIADAVSVSYLDVLHFGSVGFAFKCFNPDELDFH